MVIELTNSAQWLIVNCELPIANYPGCISVLFSRILPQESIPSSGLL
ncbi:MAG: hypothetical protein AB1567_08190 [bacterium]